jgi:hypothetical protein
VDLNKVNGTIKVDFIGAKSEFLKFRIGGNQYKKYTLILSYMKNMIILNGRKYV